MLDRLIDLAVHRRTATLLFTLALLIYGVYAYFSLPIEAYPDVTNLQVNIITLFPGQASEEVERQVTIPLERGLSALPKAIDMRSVSVFGLSYIIVTFDDEVDMYFARQVVTERLRQVDLPDGVVSVLGPQITPLGEVYQFTVEGGGKSPTELRTLLDWTIVPFLKQIPGVADIVAQGGFRKEIHILVDPDRLKAHGITLTTVYDALSRSNANIGAGHILHGQEQYIVRGLGLLRSPDDIKEIVLTAEKGTPVRVKDVATLVEAHTPRQGAVGRGTKPEAVEGFVLMRRGENPSIVLELVRQQVDRLNNGILPAGVKIVPFIDRTTFVQRTLHTVRTNLLEGALLVTGVVWLFLRSWRGSVAVAIIIPASLLTAFAGLYLIKVPANLISMGAIDFGIIVDGAVILIENIYRRLTERRPDPHRVPIVIAQAAKEVAVPTLFSLSIIMAALIPIYTFQRVEGRIFRPMAYTYAFALTGALLFSFTAVLALAALLIKRIPHQELEPWFMVAARRVIEPLVVYALRVRGVVLAGMVALLLASGFLLTRLGTEFLPELNEGDLHVYVEMPNAISLPEGQHLLAEIRRLLAQFPEVEGVLSEQGRPEDGTDTIGPNQSETFIHLHAEEGWTTGRTKVQLVEAMRGVVSNIPGVLFNFSQPIRDNVEEAISGIRGQVVIKVFGEDNEVLQAKAAEVLVALKTVRGVRDPAIYRTGMVPNLLIELDRPQIARHGLTVADIERVIETAIGGRVATEYWEGEKRFGVRVLLAEPSRATSSRIGEITIGTSDGGRIRLDTLAKIRVADGRAQIWRQNNSKFIAVKCNIGDRDMGSFVEAAMAQVEARVKLPEGYYMTWGGEFENQQRAMSRLKVVVPMAILAVIALLYLAFGSIRDALLIILVAPCAFVGGIATLWLTGTVFSVSAAVGLIALMGQTVLNGVLLVATFRQLQQEEEPMTLNDLIRKGVNMRLRAILMTALLAGLGLVPAALSHGMGSETQRPFALVIIGGIVTSTALTLFLIPVLFSFRIFAKVERPGVVPHPAPTTFMLLVALAVLAGPASGTAQGQPSMMTQVPGVSSPPVMTLSEAFKAYEAGNLERKSAQAIVEAARQQVRAAGLLENPVLSHMQGHNNTGTPTSGDHYYSNTLSQTVPLTGKLGLRRQVTEANRDAAEGSFQVRDIGLRLAVLRAYSRLLAAQQRILFTRQDLASLEEVVEVLKKRVASGATAQYDLTRGELEAERVRTELSDALADEKGAREELRKAIGPTAPAGSFIVVPVDLSPPYAEVGALTVLALSNRGDLRAARALHGGAEASAILARREVVPDVTFSLGLLNSAGPTSTDVLAGVSIPIPIIRRGQGTIQAARSTADAARLDVQALETRIHTEVIRDTAVYQQRVAERDRYQTAVMQRAERLLRTAQTAYREGARGILELVDAYRTNREVRLRDLELRTAVEAAGFDVAESVGDLTAYAAAVSP
ncbi:MAG: CusA/CzcA family heavy metal efflux RND transporter [Nitrospirae bacterium]|nr:MAG: CusA/CzcA family heavy metal efflux RND transporter [Nitrospirota bacterium]